MDILSAVVTVLHSPELLLLTLFAAVLGVFVGAIPGFTIAAAIAMLLPLSYYMEPLHALVLLYVMSKAGRYGGSIAAILFNTPGTSASAATQLDGYPLAQQGKAGKALKVAAISSMTGDLVGDLLLISSIGLLAVVAIKLGPPELFSIYLMAFVIVGSVISDAILKGLVSVFLGMLVATIGLDPISGEERFTFGIFELSSGIHLVPLMIGMFVMTEVFWKVSAVSSSSKTDQSYMDKGRSEENQLELKTLKEVAPTIARGSVIGSLIGLLPGVGSAVAAFVSYGWEKHHSKNPENWGTGELAGVAAAESANNAVSGPSMVPLLTLGIPGSTTGAILLSVFLIHGIDVGPTLFLTSEGLIYQLFVCGLLGIVAYGVLGCLGASQIARFIFRVPANILYPLVFLICFIATYSIQSSMFDVLVMLVAGIFGWGMRKMAFNTAAFIISFVLADGFEESFRQTLLMSDSGLLIFVERPIALIFVVFALLIFCLRCYREYQNKTLGSGQLHELESGN